MSELKVGAFFNCLRRKARGVSESESKWEGGSGVMAGRGLRVRGGIGNRVSLLYPDEKKPRVG